MIRPVTSNDADAIAAIYEPLVLESHVSFETDPPGIVEIRSRMSQSHAWIVDEEGGVVRGYAYAHKLHDRPAYLWSTEVSVYVAEGHRAAGVGKPLLDALLQLLLERGFVNAFALIALPNAASVRLFESAGFELVGVCQSAGYKLGRWHDVTWWQRGLNDPTFPPPALLDTEGE